MHKLWFGTEESYFAYEHAREQAAVMMAGGEAAIKAAVLAAGGGQGSDPFGLPPIWDKQGSLAVMNIDGSLINGYAGFMRLFGAIGYGDIQQALSDISLDADVKAVLLNIDSGGGQVDGVSDTGDMIRTLDATKPVMSYASGSMGSAAYWLGASARTIAAAPTSQVGSVGTIIVHSERSKARADAGIKDTVVRFGEFKALGNPIEPLSDAGKAQFQSLANESGKIFVDYVSARRGMSASDFQATAGEGRVFMGQQAKKVGLVDSVVSMTGAITAAKKLDKNSAQQQNPGNPRKGLNMKLSKKSVLAIAAGTLLDKLGLHEPEANLEGVKLEGDALAAVEAEAKEVIAAVEARVTAGVAEATKVVTAEVAELKAKAEAAEAAGKVALKALEEKVTLAEAAATTLNGKLTASAELAAKASEIVKTSMSVMSVALGGSAEVGASLMGAELMAEHDKLAEQFKVKFPQGRVAAVNGPAKPPVQTAAVNPMFAHLVKPVQ